MVLDDLYETIRSTHRRLKQQGIDFPEVEIDRIWCRVLNNRNMKQIREFAIAFECIVNPVYPMPNLKKTLLKCREKGLLMGIVSNAQFFTPLLFEWFLKSQPPGLGFHPELTLYSFRFGYAKPSLRLFRRAARKASAMGIDRQSILYVGNDMLNDIYTAERCGFKTALFAGDKRSLRLRTEDPRCHDLSPDVVVTDLVQLLNHI
jgi:putative hydrolase of the HAD superfamily